MSLQEMYYIAEMVVGLSVIISIVFVAIELRQNTYMMRRAAGDQRRERLTRYFDTVVTDGDFRDFNRRIDKEWNNFNPDERYRGIFLGVSTARSILDELVAFYDGQVSSAEMANLEWQMRIAVSRPHNQAAYEIVKNGYSHKVRKHWESAKTIDVAAKVEDRANLFSYGSDEPWKGEVS